MPYIYSDPTRETLPHALPNVEVFYSAGEGEDGDLTGWFYAFGFPGCMWDGEPMGPFDTREEAIAAAREDSTGE